MNKNPRIIIALAKELKCKPEEIISYRPSHVALSRICGTCRYFRDNLCDTGDGNPLATTADTHSCGWHSRKEQE